MLVKMKYADSSNNYLPMLWMDAQWLENFLHPAPLSFPAARPADRTRSHAEHSAAQQWKVLPKSLALEEVEQIIASGTSGTTSTGLGTGLHARSRDGAALAIRNRAMFEVFYAGALRVSEIVSLRVEDVKLEMGCVLVRGKGDKERIVPLGDRRKRFCHFICESRARS